MAIIKTKTHSFAYSLWLAISTFIAVILTFSIYVWSEKQIDLANENRQKSFLLASELRQSSEDLTRMVRTYVATGNPIYKKHFQDILDIRDGKKPRPKNYMQTYWDEALANDAPLPEYKLHKISLLELTQQAGFSHEEFNKMAQAKANSDALTSIEIHAMRLFEEQGAIADESKMRAITMLFDDNYQRLKAGIMKPIAETFVLVDQRTLAEVNRSKLIAMYFRLLFGVFAILFIIIMRRTYIDLKSQLGGSVDEVRAQIERIGSTEEIVPMEIAPGMENSILGWLANKQAELIALEQERRDAETRLIHNESYLRSIFENEPECIKVVDARGVLRKMNPAGLAMLEAESIEELAGDTLLSLVTPNYRSSFSEMFKRVFAGEKVQMQFEIIGLKGTHRWLETYAALIEDDADEKMLFSITRDITARRAAEQSLIASEERLRMMLESSPIAVRITAVSGREVLFANKRYAEMSNTGLDKINENDPKAYYADPKVYEDILAELNAGHEVTDKLVEITVPNRGNIWVIGTYQPITYNKQAAIMGWFYDVSDLKATQESLRISQELAKKSLDDLNEQKLALDKHAIVSVSNLDGEITYVNDKFCEVSGYSKQELIGQNHAIMNSGVHPKGFFEDMYNTLAKGDTWHQEVCNRAKDGSLYWLDTTVTPSLGKDGKPESYVSIRTDITLRKQAEDQSNYLAFYDPLTRLPNRRLLMDRLNHAMVASTRSQSFGAILFLDLDYFKKLNDTLGHDIGDLLLQQVSERMSACVREEDTVARLGGDEFVVLLEGLSSSTLEAGNQTEAIGEKILNALNEPYQLGSYHYSCSCSIGATLFSGTGLEMKEVLKQADVAMYQAKSEGRSMLRFFDPEMQSSIIARIALEAELRTAIEQQQFKLLYQPQVYHNGSITGAEVLIRWEHPERGLVSPFEFIPLAEETGLIVPIGQWVLETACAQIKAWEHSLNTQRLQLSVNVSARQFYKTDFVQQVQQALARTGINADLLKLELTESLVLDDIEGTIQKMHQLRAIGVRFAMDDFGTGHSSLSYLTQLPLDQLKIDQSFVRNIGVKDTDAVIVQTIIGMGNNLGMEVIAEGVETEMQRAFLEANGCPICQGYLFSKPVPLDEFERLLTTA